MSDRDYVNLNDKILLTKNVRVEGHTLSEAPEQSPGMFECTISELLDPDFGTKHQYPQDTYFFPGKHESKIYRYQINDAQFYAKDQFKFALVPLDIDIISDTGRERWASRLQADRIINKLYRQVPALHFAHIICSSRGGIRAIFVLGEYLNALQWRTAYNKLVKSIIEKTDAQFGKRGKILFEVDELKFALDLRNPGSLTRVPYGYRDNKPVAESDYFYARRGYKFYDLDASKVVEADLVKMDRKGYTTINLPIPRPEKTVPLPDWLKPYQWPDDEPPEKGTRELTIFAVTSRAKYRYTDRLTAEQYYSYFYDAMSQIDDDDMCPLDMMWSKIIRNFYVRSSAITPTGKKYDTQQLNHSGGITFYPATDFDKVLQPYEVYRYSKKEQKKNIKFLLEMDSGTVFLNPPPGAGKSTAAVRLLKEKGGIYIAPSNKQINDIMKRLECEANIVLSYRELIKVVCAGDEQAINLLEAKYDLEYHPAYKNAQYHVELLLAEDPTGIYDKRMMIRRRGFYMVRTFPQFIEDQFPVQADLMKKENARRIKCLEDGHLSLLTKDKFMTLMHRATTQSLPLDHQIIYDEAEPEDIIDPDVYHQSDPVKIFDQEFQPWLDIDTESQLNFIDFLRSRPAIFINANRGLDRALKYNGFDDVTVLGAEMRPVLDNDLHIVLSPDLKAGYAPHRNEDDDTEISPRALYAKQVNSKTYTLMTNGKDIEGNPLASQDNLKRVIGSNDYINSKVISIITTPTPEQIAELCFCAGMKPENAKKLLFQNLVNQVVSRNVGYRGHKITNEIRTQELNQIESSHNNEHILVLPQATLNDEMDLIVKTTNVWTMKSKKVPAAIEPYIELVPLAVKTRAELYQVSPGGYTTLEQLSQKMDTPSRQLSFILKDLKNDPMLADFELKGRTKIGGKHLRNVIQRFETLVEIVADCFRKISNGYRFMDFIKLLAKQTSERYIKALTAKDLKTYIRQESFRFDFRVIKIRNIEYLVRTGAEEYFEPLTLRKPSV